MELKLSDICVSYLHLWYPGVFNAWVYYKLNGKWFACWFCLYANLPFWSCDILSTFTHKYHFETSTKK